MIKFVIIYYVFYVSCMIFYESAELNWIKFVDGQQKLSVSPVKKIAKKDGQDPFIRRFSAIFLKKLEKCRTASLCSSLLFNMNNKVTDNIASLKKLLKKATPSVTYSKKI